MITNCKFTYITVLYFVFNKTEILIYIHILWPIPESLVDGFVVYSAPFYNSAKSLSVIFQSLPR